VIAVKAERIDPDACSDGSGWHTAEGRFPGGHDRLACHGGPFRGSGWRLFGGLAVTMGMQRMRGPVLSGQTLLPA
jgi:hypothetical protein